MAITVDSTTVAQVTTATGVATTATFNVPADTMVVALVIAVSVRTLAARRSPRDDRL